MSDAVDKGHTGALISARGVLSPFECAVLAVDPEGEVFGLWEWKTGGSWWSCGWSSGVVRFGPEEDEDRDEEVKSVSLEELGEPCGGSWELADIATDEGTL